MTSTTTNTFPAEFAPPQQPPLLPPQEAILIISRDSGRIIDIILHDTETKIKNNARAKIHNSPRLSLPPLLAPQCRYIDLKSALIMPGPIDIYTGTCLERTTATPTGRPRRPTSDRWGTTRPPTPRWCSASLARAARTATDWADPERALGPRGRRASIFYWGHGTREPLVALGTPWLPLGSLGCPWKNCPKLGHAFVEIIFVSSGQEPQISSNPRETSLLLMTNEN